jgi:hypothetical protein
MGGNIPLPALDIRPVQQPDVMGDVSKLYSLRSLLNQQQLQQQTMQANQQEIAIRQRQMQSAQAMQDLFPKFVQRDQSGKPTGYDYDGLMTAAGAAGLDPATLEHLQTMRKSAADTAKTVTETHGKEIENQNALLDQAFQHIEGIRGESDPNQRQANWNSALAWASQNNVDVSKLPQQAPDDKGLNIVEATLGMHKQALADLKAQGEIQKSQAETGEATAKAGQAQQETKNLQAALPKIQAESSVAPQMANLGVTQRQTEISKNRAQTAEAIASTAKDRAETENLGQQPIFAVDPQTNERVMTTRPEQLAKGYTNPVAVKEGDVAKETDARAMINDVQLNKSRYLSAMQRVYSEPMTTAQKNALVALTPEKLGVDFGSLFKLELPDVIQKVANASSFSVLSPAQKQAVVGYYSTLASVPAAQKALTNIGKANKEMMDLELRTIPTPLMDQGTFQTMLDRFQGNIDQTSRKTVRMPGMPSTDDIRKLYEGRQQTQQGPSRIPVNMSLYSILNSLR